jgi:RimJ/RimL family protein N-acetyltransferase
MIKRSYARHPDFDKVVKAYRDRYGIDLSHMRMRWSKHPVYTNGSRSHDFEDDETGGSWRNDSSIAINPDMKSVMERFGITDQTQAEFRRRIIAHELAHEVYRKKKAKELIRIMLEKAKEENFTTPYLQTVPDRKMDEETFAEYMSDQLNKKAESYSFKEDPTYEDALKVFNRLDFDDRANLVPRHPDFLRKVPDDMLFDRQVVVDGKGDPVGFQEFYSRKDKRGRRLPPHNIIAVAPEARGNGLARIMTEAAIRKARKEKVKRLLWEAFAYNEPSIRAALSAGFEDATPKNAKGYRKLVYSVSEKKASSKRETYESGEGEVESYTPGKTEDHDEIVIRLKDGRRVRISNNTKLGKILRVRVGSRIGYHGYRVGGTDVVHRVHPNRRSRGGWMERLPQKA